MQRPLAVLTPTPLRRVATLLALAFGAAFLIWTAITASFETFAWRPLFLVLGLACMLFGAWVWRATEVALLLTEDALTDSAGRQLCRVDDIVKVDRGTFAFKPSNGFVVHLRAAGPRAWAPGLWWRLGRRLGVGGVTSGTEARLMADMLTAIVEHRGET
ncbi:MAG: hypothetical protein AAGH83_09370 [Pseudomonadota bacterium]